MNTTTEPTVYQGWWSIAWQERRSWFLSFAVLLLSLAVWKINGGETVFPQNWIEAFPFAATVDEFDKWLRPFVQPTTRAIGEVVSWFYQLLVDFLIFTQWQVVFVILVLPAFACGGLRLGLLAIFAVGSWLVLDFWDESMETLSLMSISILISIVIGVLLGIWASQSYRF